MNRRPAVGCDWLNCCLYFPVARNRKVTICARVQPESGLKVETLVPAVMPWATAHRTASA